MIKYGINNASNFKLQHFATGSYGCKCARCGEKFIGDKRATQCLQCALDDIESLLHKHLVRQGRSEDMLREEVANGR